MRRSGQTTRLVDRWIQEFFTNGFTFIYEGRDSENQKVMNQEALNRFKRRMDSEHNNIKFKNEYGKFDGIFCFKITKIN